MGVEEKSTAELLGDLSNELTALIHHEMELAKGVPPIPDEAIETSKEDVEWLKIQARSAKP